MEQRDSDKSDEKKSAKQILTPLPMGFEPGEFDVIIGRGSNIFNHVGNINFRKRVESRVQEYSEAKTKTAKSAILASIVADIKGLSPNGGFVRKDTETSRWFEVGQALAREKVSQCFRDALHDSYRSSNKTKRKRRIEEQAISAEISSEMQREAMEQLQSGRTDKRLYELICQQQSVLSEAQRPQTAMREEKSHGQRQRLPDFRISEYNTNPNSPVPTHREQQPSTLWAPPQLPNFEVTREPTPNVGQLLRRDEVATLPFIASSATSSYEPELQTPMAAHTLLSPDYPREFPNLFPAEPAFQTRTAEVLIALDQPSQDVLASSCSSSSTIEFAYSMDDEIGPSNTKRTDDPFEPVPLPEEIDAAEMERILDP